MANLTVGGLAPSEFKSSLPALPTKSGRTHYKQDFDPTAEKGAETTPEFDPDQPPEK